MKKLGFGLMRLPIIKKEDGWEFDIPQLTKMVDTFLAKGFVYFDTAYSYHDNQSEKVVKEVLVKRYPRQSFKLATKMPTWLLNEKEDLDRLFNQQLEKTGAGYFDYYLIHCLSTELYEKAKKVDAFSFVSNKKQEGKILKMGFSFHDTADVLDKILTDHPEVDFVQLQINYLDWENEKIQSRKCYEVALKHNKEIIVMEPVKGGALANIPKKAEDIFKANNKDMSVASWAIRYAAGLPNVIMVLSGMSNIMQLDDNVSFMENFVPLTEGEKKLCFKAADIINSLPKVPCTACNYCTENCPAKIAIPEFFAAYNKALKTDDSSEYKELLTRVTNPSDCINCKNCESRCPQKIEIVKMLKKVQRYFDN